MAKERMTEQDVIDKWGSTEAYYFEVKRFHQQHESAHAIEYDTETGVPIKAVYLFWPRQVCLEHYQLREAIAAQAAVPSQSDEKE